MKKLLLVILLISSVSAFAQPTDVRRTLIGKYKIDTLVTERLYVDISAGLSSKMPLYNPTTKQFTYVDTTQITSTDGSVTITQVGRVVNFSVGGVQSYTPTPTNTTNIAASTAHVTYFIKIGEWVYVWGEIEIDATAATTISELQMDVPVATSVNNALFGTGSAEDNTSVRIFANSGGTVRLRFTPQTATNNTYSFHYSYKWTAP